MCVCFLGGGGGGGAADLLNLVTFPLSLCVFPFRVISPNSLASTLLWKQNCIYVCKDVAFHPCGSDQLYGCNDGKLINCMVVNIVN